MSVTFKLQHQELHLTLFNCSEVGTKLFSCNHVYQLTIQMSDFFFDINQYFQITGDRLFVGKFSLHFKMNLALMMFDLLIFRLMYMQNRNICFIPQNILCQKLSINYVLVEKNDLLFLCYFYTWTKSPRIVNLMFCFQTGYLQRLMP